MKDQVGKAIGKLGWGESKSSRARGSVERLRGACNTLARCYKVLQRVTGNKINYCVTPVTPYREKKLSIHTHACAHACV